MEYSIKPKTLGERRIIHQPQKRIIGLYVYVLSKKGEFKLINIIIKISDQGTVVYRDASGEISQNEYEALIKENAKKKLGKLKFISYNKMQKQLCSKIGIKKYSKVKVKYAKGATKLPGKIIYQTLEGLGVPYGSKGTLSIGKSNYHDAYGVWRRSFSYKDNSGGYASVYIEENGNWVDGVLNYTR